MEVPKVIKALGPGLVTGASDDDPSGIATYAQAGAQFGNTMLWTALLTFPLMLAVQEMCDRIASTTGHDLGTLARKRFGSRGRVVVGILLCGLLIANAFNIAADLVAIGAGMHLLHLGPIWLWAVLSSIGLTVAVIAGSFAVLSKVFDVLCLVLLAYIVEFAFVSVHWGDVLLHTFVPHFSFDRTHVELLIALLGTTISPYLYFWQTTHRVEEMKSDSDGGGAVALKRRTKRAAKEKLTLTRFDTFSGMALSQAVMFAIIAVTAATLHAHGHTSVDTPAAAAQSLQPIAGHIASAVFALGFIGTGALAVPVLAGSGAAGLAGLLGRRDGFSRSPREAPMFYGLVAVGTIGGALMALVGGNPVHLLVLAAVINGVAAAPFLVVVLLIANHKPLMSKYVNKPLANTLGVITVVIMAAAAIGLLFV